MEERTNRRQRLADPEVDRLKEAFSKQSTLLARIDERIANIAAQMETLNKHIDQLYQDTRASVNQLSDYKTSANLRMTQIESRISRQEALGDFQRKLSFGVYMAIAAALASGIGYLLLK